MTHTQLLSVLTQEEFNYWLAMEQVDPMYSDWHGMALICQTIANVFSKKAYPIDTWLPVKPPKPKQSQHDLFLCLSALVRHRTFIEIGTGGINVQPLHKCRCSYRSNEEHWD